MPTSSTPGFCVTDYNHMPEMVAAHRTAVRAFRHATDQSTIAALRKAKASQTADLMARVLGVGDDDVPNAG